MSICVCVSYVVVKSVLLLCLCVLLLDQTPTLLKRHCTHVRLCTLCAMLPTPHVMPYVTTALLITLALYKL